MITAVIVYFLVMLFTIILGKVYEANDRKTNGSFFGFETIINLYLLMFALMCETGVFGLYVIGYLVYWYVL